MRIHVFVLLLAAALAHPLAWAAPDGRIFQIKVLALQPNGSLAEGLTPQDWRIKAGGDPAKVLSQRPPSVMGQLPAQWVLVLLPVQGAEVRKLALLSIAHFLETLPVSDRVLILHRGEHGLQSLTPGFTARPSLWAAALDQALLDFHASLRGTAEDTFVLPASPTGEPQEAMTPIQTFIRKLQPMDLPKRADDGKSRRDILEDYSPQELGGVTPTVTHTLDALVALAEALKAVPGEKQVVVFSRNEIDDLGSPLWSNAIAKSGLLGTRRHVAGAFTSNRENNDLLQVQFMVSEVSLARERVKTAFARNGITLHNVSGGGPAYEGALGEAVQATGGYNFHFTGDLSQRLPQVLGAWLQCYELTLETPKGDHPVRLEVETTRKDLKLLAPTLR